MVKHTFRRTLAAFALATTFALGAGPATAWAGDVDAAYEAIKGDAAKLLDEADNRSNAFDDQTITVRMTLKGGSNDGNTIKITTITKGESMRAIRFEEPADMKGMGVVIKGKDEIYVRLPGAEKVRRVGSHAKRQSFQGTDWGFDDMALIRLGSDYTPTITNETDTHVEMDLAGKSDDLAYPSLKIKIAKSNLMIDWIEYYDDDGKAVKRQERGKPKKLGGKYDIHTEVTMTTLSTGTSTVNEVLEETIDQNVEDSTFSRRWLIRGL